MSDVQFEYYARLMQILLRWVNRVRLISRKKLGFHNI